MTTSPRKPFQFGLGSLIWLILLLAILLGWYTDRARLQADRARLQSDIAKHELDKARLQSVLNGLLQPADPLQRARLIRFPRQPARLPDWNIERGMKIDELEQQKRQSSLLCPFDDGHPATQP